MRFLASSSSFCSPVLAWVTFPAPLLDDSDAEGLVVDPELRGALPDALLRFRLPGLPVVIDRLEPLLLRILPESLRLGPGLCLLNLACARRYLSAPLCWW